mgnify:CR=1 FL=1
MSVIPREGVESPRAETGPDLLVGHVIPREGVESDQQSCPVVSVWFPE